MCKEGAKPNRAIVDQKFNNFIQGGHGISQMIGYHRFHNFINHSHQRNTPTKTNFLIFIDIWLGMD
jgi:hypothetical protein